MSPRDKRFGNAGRALSALIRVGALTNDAAARQLGVPPETLRSWIAGWSAPREGDPVYERFAQVLGEAAAAQYQQAVTVSRNRPLAEGGSIARRAEKLTDRGRLTEAEVLLREAEGLDGPERTAAYRQLARGFFDSGLFEQGIRCYQEAASLTRTDPTASELLIEEVASRLTVARLFDEGFRLLDKELAIRISSARLWKRLGVMQWYDGQLVAAYASLTTSLSLGAKEPRIFHARGQVLAELALWDQAIVELRTAIESPISLMSQAYARSCLAYVMFQLGAHEETEREFEAVQAVAPDNAWHYYRWAICREQLGDVEQARVLLERALESRGPALTPRQIIDAHNRLQAYN